MEYPAVTQRLRIPPISDALCNVAAMEPAGGWRVLVRKGAAMTYRSCDLVQAIGSEHQTSCNDEVCVRRHGRRQQTRKMPWKPEVVMAEIGNKAATCQPYALVVRDALAP